MKRLGGFGCVKIYEKGKRDRVLFLSHSILPLSFFLPSHLPSSYSICHKPLRSKSLKRVQGKKKEFLPSQHSRKSFEHLHERFGQMLQRLQLRDFEVQHPDPSRRGLQRASTPKAPRSRSASFWYGYQKRPDKRGFDRNPEHLLDLTRSRLKKTIVIKVRSISFSNFYLVSDLSFYVEIIISMLIKFACLNMK